MQSYLQLVKIFSTGSVTINLVDDLAFAKLPILIFLQNLHFSKLRCHLNMQPSALTRNVSTFLFCQGLQMEVSLVT